MKKYIWLIVLLMLIFIPKVVKAEVIEITQDDLTNACLSGQTVKGISCSGGDFYIESGEYKLGSDFTSDNTIWIYIDDSNVKLDLNNKIVTNGYIRVQNSGTLEVSGEGTITNGGDIFNVFDDSTLIINSGNFTCTSRAVYVENNGKLIINGGYFEGGYGLLIEQADTIEINGGTFVGAAGAMFETYNSLTITDGTFNGGTYGIIIQIISDNMRETKLSGGNYTATKQNKYNDLYNSYSNVIYVYNDDTEDYEHVSDIEQVIGSIAIWVPYGLNIGNMSLNDALEEGYRFKDELNIDQAYYFIMDFYDVGETISGYTSEGEYFVETYYEGDWVDGYYQDGHWEGEEFIGENWVEGYNSPGYYVDDSVAIRIIHATDTDNSIIPIEGEYEIIEGENQTYNDSDLVIKSNGDYSLFQKLLVDEEEVDSSNYTVESGSTIVTLKKEYIDTLDEGRHTVTFVYVNGQVSTNFTINANAPQISNMPETFDNIYTNIIVLITSMIMLIVIKKRFI